MKLRFFPFEINYKIFMTLNLIAQLKLPYAFSDGNPKNILFIFPIANFAVSAYFIGKFRGMLQLVPLENFLIYKLVAHIIPISYYFMFRRSFSVNLPWFIMAILCEAALYLSLLLDGLVFKYITIGDEDDDKSNQ